MGDPIITYDTRCPESAVAERPAPLSRLTIGGDTFNATHSTANLVKTLETRSNRSFEDRVTCAMLVKELRDRVVRGDMGPGIKWYVWAAENIQLGKTRLKEHMRVACAKDPRAEVERLMRLAEDRARRSDAKAAAEGEGETRIREALANFARRAAIEKVKKINEDRMRMYSRF